MAGPVAEDDTSPVEATADPAHNESVVPKDLLYAMVKPNATRFVGKVSQAPAILTRPITVREIACMASSWSANDCGWQRHERPGGKPEYGLEYEGEGWFTLSLRFAKNENDGEVQVEVLADGRDYELEDALVVIAHGAIP